MRKSLLPLALTLLLAPISSYAQWTFQGTFPDETFEAGTLGGHGIAVDPEGKVWFQPFSATDSVQVPDLGNEHRATRVIYVYNADGTPASFSPLKFVDLPGGERDTLGGLVEIDANGDKAWEGKSGRGLRADSDGNIIVSQWRYLYKINYQTGAGMAKNIFDDYCSLSAPATDDLGNVFVAPVCPGPPIRALDGDLQLLDNAVDVTHGFSRSFEVSADGNTIFWSGYTNHAVVLYQRADEFSSFDSLGVTLEGFDSESMTINAATGHLWASAGSLNDLPNRYDGVATNWLPQTWYGFEIDDLLARDSDYTPIGSFSWSPDGLEGRPRGLAFSPDGLTAYATQFSQPGSPIQVFMNSGPGGVAIERGDTAIPTKFTLSQNYPNPFNPTTRIDFTLNQPGFAVLKVLDMMGREIATLANEDLPAGTYHATFDGANLSSGTYLYTLQFADQRLTGRMTLLK